MCYLPKPKAEADNTNRGLNNSSYPTRTEFNNCFIKFLVRLHGEYNIQSRHFMYKKGRVNSNSRIISTDEDPSIRIESSAIINLRGVSTKLNK